MDRERNGSGVGVAAGCAFAVVIALLAPAVAADPSTGGVAGEAQRMAPDFAFEDINPASPTHGQTLALSDLYGERGLVLQFVASWCKPCREELPHLQELHEDDAAPIVLVAADEYGYTEGVLIVAERSKLTTPLLFVPKEDAEEMERRYDHEILPATYLIGRDGSIREVHQGAWSKQRLAAAIANRLR